MLQGLRMPWNSSDQVTKKAKKSTTVFTCPTVGTAEPSRGDELARRALDKNADILCNKTDARTKKFSAHLYHDAIIELRRREGA
ncbi:hypothetical protein AB6A40_011406 [Gnathostoma spinigerum]|uniref:Uncharacterized protein n=1 Tax=Gnathostoma spinigerum TaxID=75299 RepID=A0ABD6F4A3_9BILA